jgi:hypothetical protein
MSPLLCLPVELRNEIYAYVIQNGTYRFRDRVVVQSGWLHLEVYMEEPRPRWAGLLCTSRQINTETRLLPYSLNIFSVLTVQQLRYSSSVAQARRETSLLFDWNWISRSIFLQGIVTWQKHSQAEEGRLALRKRWIAGSTMHVRATI